MTDIEKPTKEYKSTPEARKLATEYYHKNKERLVKKKREEYKSVKKLVKKMNCKDRADYIFIKFQKLPDKTKVDWGQLARFELLESQNDEVELRGKILKMVEEAIGDRKDFKIINEIFRIFDVDLLGK